MTYQQGDIVWVPYPFSDQPGNIKTRPAIVVSNAASNKLDNDVLIAQITSIIRNDPFSFKINNNDIVAPLPKESEIRCNKIATIRTALILGKLSSLKHRKLSALIRHICKVFK